MVSPVVESQSVPDLSFVSAPHAAIPNYTLDRTTKFGMAIASLYDSLSALSADAIAVGSLNWCKAAFPLVKDYFSGIDLTEIQISNHEQMFLMTDPVANEIRRIYTHEWCAQKILKALDQEDAELTPADREKVLFLAKVMTGYGYSSFFGADVEYLEDFLKLFPDAREKLIDLDRLVKTFEEVDSSSFMLHGFLRSVSHRLDVECRENSNKLLKEWRDYQRVYGATDKRALTDPAHLWVSPALDFFMICRLDLDLTLRKIRLSKPT